jgi:hypothetical protein
VTICECAEGEGYSEVQAIYANLCTGSTSKACGAADQFFVMDFFSRKIAINNWPFGKTMVFENPSRVLIVN